MTTSSSPKRTIAVGEYQKTRSKVVYAREILFEDLGVGGDVDMEKSEEERESPFSGRDEPSVGTTRALRVQSVRVAAATGRSLMLERCPLRGMETMTTPFRLRL
ncbi:hypothetical protein PF008_g9316 [Phytophthora fragariae]|uniref:Uncharacterized protein n=1 Tax=Phytophthora fragariae TaxID=53985 RepID=A0A6G0RX73_9STRA|nr:hypothetical protein PF008_g9316 [Phytophthora fragariae]